MLLHLPLLVTLYVIIGVAAALVLWQGLNLAARGVECQSSRGSAPQSAASVNRFARDRWSASSILGKAR
jgi:hypothetical protein